MVAFDNEIEITPDTPDAWRDVDVSAYVPVGAKGVILHFDGVTSTFYEHGARKNGSTDGTNTSTRVCHYWAAVGIDTNRVLELYVGDTTNVSVFLVGYFTENSYFLTNRVNKTPSSGSTWTDETTPLGTKGVILDIISGTSGDPYGIRKNGSTDARVGVGAQGHCWAIIGVDTSGIYEAYCVDQNNTYMYQVGYLFSDSVFYTNATNISLGSTNDWYDLTAIPRTNKRPVGGYIEVIHTSGEFLANYGFRKKGSTDNILNQNGYHPFGIIGCDADGIIQGQIASTSLDFFLVGYATEVTSKIQPKNYIRPAPFSPGNAR